MNEEEKRKKAIELFQSGEQVTKICKQLGKSRKWFYKWKNRFINNSLGQWFKDDSKAPHHHPNKRNEQLEKEILDVRKKLELIKYAQKGAISIQYEFLNQGKEAPPIWTINRVLKKHDLVKKKSSGYKSKNIPYPGSKYISVHQMDFVCPRYIKDFGRVYSLNIMDIETHYANVNPVPGKHGKYIIPSVIRFWQEYGFPDYLQMDNELSFRGSNINPLSPGQLIRFVLSQGVGVIFTPISEPWRNGIIEKFNDVFDKYFYRKNIFTDLEDMKNKARQFELFHNQQHRYSANNSRTPIEQRKLLGSITKMNHHYILPKKIPLVDGEIILIRFVRSDLKIKLFGQTFILKNKLKYSYVECIIVVEKNKLVIMRDNFAEHVFDFFIPYR